MFTRVTIAFSHLSRSRIKGNHPLALLLCDHGYFLYPKTYEGYNWEAIGGIWDIFPWQMLVRRKEMQCWDEIIWCGMWITHLVASHVWFKIHMVVHTLSYVQQYKSGRRETPFKKPFSTGRSMDVAYVAHTWMPLFFLCA